jgi:hypothetical protein
MYVRRRPSPRGTCWNQLEVRGRNLDYFDPRIGLRNALHVYDFLIFSPDIMIDQTSPRASQRFASIERGILLLVKDLDLGTSRQRVLAFDGTL